MEKYRQVGEFEYYHDTENSDQSMKEIMEDVFNSLYGRGCWEPMTEEIMKQNIKEGDIVVDIGASIGYFTLLMAKLVGSTGKVISIEPTKNQFEYLLKNIEKNGFNDRVTAVNTAASDVNGTMQVQVNALADKISPCSIIDEILPERVDFIKMDIDGSEPRAIKGLIETIKRNPQLKMMVEYLVHGMKDLHNEPQQLIDVLDKYFTYTIKDNYNLFCVRK